MSGFTVSTVHGWMDGGWVGGWMGGWMDRGWGLVGGWVDAVSQLPDGVSDER